MVNVWGVLQALQVVLRLWLRGCSEPLQWTPFSASLQALCQEKYSKGRKKSTSHIYIYLGDWNHLHREVGFLFKGKLDRGLDQLFLTRKSNLGATSFTELRRKTTVCGTALEVCIPIALSDVRVKRYYGPLNRFIMAPPADAVHSTREPVVEENI